jgi:hypothetical protein
MRYCLQDRKWNELSLSRRLSWECLLLIYLGRLPTPPQYWSMTKCNLDYPRSRTKNCWHSVDAHFDVGAGSVSLSLLLRRLAMPHLWLSALNCHSEYQRYKSTNRWFSVATHFQAVAERVSHLFFDYNGGQWIKKWQLCTIIGVLRLTVGYSSVTINSTSQIQYWRF